MAGHPPIEKPYGFVSIEPLGSGDRDRPVGHEQYHPGTVSGQFKATLIVATPLHVAAGSIRMQEKSKTPLVREMTRKNGQLCVPGSTLKGVLRTVVESVTRSCVRITHADPSQLPTGAEGCRDRESLCLACRMFGALGFEGHVRIEDAVMRSDQGKLRVVRMPVLFMPRSQTRAYVAKGYVRGRKFYRHGQTALEASTPVEVLLPESQLSFTVQFENLKPAELGVLLTAMGLHPEYKFMLKLGGGKPACYGSLLVKPNRLEVWEDPQTLYADYDIQKVGKTPKPYFEAANAVILVGQLRELMQLWTYTPQRHCPEGNY